MQFKGTPKEVANQLVEWAGGVGAGSVTIQVTWVESAQPTSKQKDHSINKFDCKNCLGTGRAGYDDFYGTCVKCDGRGYFEF
jgi:hypothetical protein